MSFSIKNKLISGFTIKLIILFVVTLFIIGKFSESNKRLQSIVDDSHKKVTLSYEVMTALLQVCRYEKNIIMETDPIKKNHFKDQINSTLQIVDDKADELDELVDQHGKTVLKDFNTAWNKYKIQLDQIVSLAMKNDDESAARISIDSALKIRDKTITLMEKIIDKNEKSLQNDKAESNSSYSSSLYLTISLLVLSILITVLISIWIIRSITKRISGITEEAEKIASRELTGEKMTDDSKDEMSLIFDALANINESFLEISENANTVASGDYSVSPSPKSDKDTLGNALQKMTLSLRETTAANEKHNWLATGKNELNEKIIGEQSIEEISTQTIRFLCSYLKAEIGAIYLLNTKEKILELSGQYAFLSPENIKTKFHFDEGLIGQAAREQKTISLNHIDDSDFNITSSLLNTKPKHLLIIPFVFEGITLGVIEIGRLTKFSETDQEFLDNSLESIAISINSAMARKKIQELLEETQMQSEELQSQQEELKQMNEELEEQTQNLKQQQEELQITNEELQEQTLSLEMKNNEVELAKKDIEEKTKQLEISSRYKSEFLANMSHELRTPLNSLLILSKDLSENRLNNLNEEQVESAEIIYKSGTDLLTLINEVLDLSKIEAGKMSVHIEIFSLRNTIHHLIRDFRHQFNQKGLELNVSFADDIPEYIKSDSQRLNQILKNLLSNALKFTHQGKVGVHVNKHSDDSIIIEISDTGIGIAQEKQLAIFEAFQQAEGGTSRKYGGTGLGLSISRELAKLLHAQIKLKSELNKGSVFSVILPIEIQGENTLTEELPLSPNKSETSNSRYVNYPALNDDRDIIEISDRSILIIEDDLKFAAILLKQAREKGFKCLTAATGEDGILLAKKYNPDAIILDLILPGISGNHVLIELKSDPKTRHIPVHIISNTERSLQQIKNGAREFLMKPVDKKDLDNAFKRIEDFINKRMKNLLIIEDNENARKAMRKLIGNGDVRCFEAEKGSDALELYQEHTFDCIILDIGLPDMSGFDLIYKMENIKDRSIPPIIIYTGKELTKEENEELLKYSENIIIKGVKSEERLLDESALFLHRTISKLPKPNQEIIEKLYDKEAIFLSKKVLVVDDDMRNVFALSKILKERGLEVLKAENGKNALEMLEKNDDVSLVLMDIMMPEMDGYEAMQQIRLNPKFKLLPIIAVTAKAMKDDKQKCIDAGANDYITKPIDSDRLITLIRVWLNK